MARFTTELYEALKVAYASGATRITYEDRTIEYGSRAELVARLREAEAELGVARDRTTRILPSTRTGL